MSGRPAIVSFVFDPPVIALTRRTVAGTGERGNRYVAGRGPLRGEFSIPEMRGTRIPVIVKRRSTEAKVEA